MMSFLKRNVYQLFKIFSLPLLVFIICEIFLEVIKIDEQLPHFDKFAHFVCGASISFSLIILIKNLESNHLVRDRKFHANALIITAVVGIIALLWELMEFTVDSVFDTNFQESALDTRLDLAFGLLGGIVTLFFYRSINVTIHFIKVS